MARQLFRNTKIYSPVDTGRPHSGKAQGELAHFPKGALLVEDGLIIAVGEEHEVLAGMQGGRRGAGGRLPWQVYGAGFCRSAYPYVFCRPEGIGVCPTDAGNCVS